MHHTTGRTQQTQYNGGNKTALMHTDKIAFSRATGSVRSNDQKQKPPNESDRSSGKITPERDRHVS
jgi:hypothetical protein